MTEKLLLTYRPLKGCRAPVPTKPVDTTSDKYVPFQHGPHIDSMPLEEPLSPIEGPKVKIATVTSISERRHPNA